MFVWSFKSKLEKKGKENNDVKNICKKKKKIAMKMKSY